MNPFPQRKSFPNTVLLLFTIVAAACAKESRDTPPAATTESTIAPVTSADTARVFAGGGVPGHPEDHGLAFKLYKDARGFNAHRVIPLEGNFRCRTGECGAKDEVHLEIFPTDRARGHDWRAALDVTNDQRKGHIVARIVNHDNVPYEPLSLNPRDTVYLWVGRNKDGEDRPKLIRFRGTRVEHVKSGGPVRFCPTNNNPNDKPEAHVLEPGNVCPDRTLPFPPPRHVGASKVPDNPLWISCSNGCCQATY